MRFRADGPSFPDELLTARDEGQVLFFCGAGVSRARAGLPDFYGLADKVVEALRAAADSPARRLIQAAKTMEPIAGVGGLLPADRVFALLEREYRVRDVRAAVAEALRPPSEPDLSAHRVLLDLARDPTGTVRLVTTNFDLLFEACDAQLARSAPPRLPDPARAQDFKGVIHLHGHVTDAYDGAHDDEFVLSSADFGRAYLAEGWATQFMRGLIDRYRLVFIGYAADDPPIQYLLEALNRDANARGGLYAFQSGDDEGAAALWKHKGVRAIPYSADNGHAQLWDSLGAWAERARDSDAWRSGILSAAIPGPEALAPFERGQVKHIVSTAAGAQAFATAAPSAEWLCTFDPGVRYGRPRKEEDGTIFDPFTVYGLDDDPVPSTVDPENYFRDRRPPADAWDAFAPNAVDLEGLEPKHIGPLRGQRALMSTDMVARLWRLSVWLVEVCDQPAAVWWAAGWGGLHPDVQFRIRRRLQTLTGPVGPVDTAWRWALRIWSNPPKNDLAGFDLQAEVGRTGWTFATVRTWSAICRPHVSIQRALLSSRPPPLHPELTHSALVTLDVEYPRHELHTPFPDVLLPLVAAELRRNLEVGVDLEVETTGFEGLTLPPIAIDPAVGGDEYSRTHSMGALLFDYLGILERLLVADPKAMRSETAAWRPNGAVFARLRVWAAGRADILKPAEAARIVLGLDRSAFWDGGNQRDLLLALATRWASIPSGLRRRLERRLLAGPLLGGGPKAERRPRRAHRMLARLIWLQNQGCTFSIDLAPTLSSLRAEAPQWKDVYADGAAGSLESRSGWVGKDLDTRGLEHEPPATLLRRAAELGGHDFGAMTDRVPLAGLAEAHPARLLRALSLAVGRGEEPVNAWETFLLAETRASDQLRLVRATGNRLARLSDSLFARLLHPITEWMLRLASRLQAELPDVFNALWTRALEAMRANPETAESSALNTKGYDWATHALNAPGGKLAQALLKDPAAGSAGLPASWLARAETLLDLGDAARRDALVFFAHQLPYLNYHAPVWTERHILGVLGADAEDEHAFWSGFFWAAKFPGFLLFKRLKPYLLAMASDPSKRGDRLEIAAGLILTGWSNIEEATGQSPVSDDELLDALRADDGAFHHQVLWQLQAWSRANGGEWRPNALRLLRDVWPRELVVRGPKISEDLFALAIETGDDFPAFVEAVTPLMTPLDQNAHCMLALTLDDGKADGLDQQALLSLVFTALPENAAAWPWGADVVVERFSRSAAISDDARTLQLRRRLANR
jgi:hypothetical protein